MLKAFVCLILITLMPLVIALGENEDGLLPQIDIQMLTAALVHSESLIESGKCHVLHYTLSSTIPDVGSEWTIRSPYRHIWGTKETWQKKELPPYQNQQERKNKRTDR